MALVLAQALIGEEPDRALYAMPGFLSGSAKLHADAHIAEQALAEAKAVSSASIRRLEPETETALLHEPFPEAKLPVVAA